MRTIGLGICLFFYLNILLVQPGFTQSDSLDARVNSFLENNKNNWRDMNIPEQDGQVLYDIIVKNNYTSVLEIGTSTGRSGIWIAWALSKTGGKLTTIEIDEERYHVAAQNFKMAGVDRLIEQKLGDAHRIIKQLDGPFDLVFVDADKRGYRDYLKNLLPKLKPGGCFTAHNVSNTFMAGIEDFLQYVYSIDSLETTIDRSSNAGISISYKKH